MKLKSFFAAPAICRIAACAETTSEPTQTAPVAGDASDLAGFEGARAGQAENGLTSRGYELVRTEGLTAYWYNAENTTCARIVTADGRYSSVTAVPLDNCAA